MKRAAFGIFLLVFIIVPQSVAAEATVKVTNEGVTSETRINVQGEGESRVELNSSSNSNTNVKISVDGETKSFSAGTNETIDYQSDDGSVKVEVNNGQGSSTATVIPTKNPAPTLSPTGERTEDQNDPEVYIAEELIENSEFENEKKKSFFEDPISYIVDLLKSII